MCLIAWIRVLITTLVVAGYAPCGHAFGLGDAELGRAGHLAVSIFIGRRTRVAASQQFDVANPARSVATVAFYELRGRVESSRAPNSRNNRAPSPRQAVPCITASVVGASRANRSSMPAVCGACAK